MKHRKCANPECRKEFTPAFSTTQKVCKWQCGLAIKDQNHDKARKAIASQERVEHRERKEKVKTRGQHMQECQIAFNAYIRMRDQIAGHCCISSGRPLDWSGNATDAGHYRSVGSAPHLRFDERNCHAQSKQDNRFLSGNAVDYRIGLIARIGLEAVEALEADQSTRKYTIEDLKAIKAEYRAKIREMKKSQEAL